MPIPRARLRRLLAPLFVAAVLFAVSGARAAGLTDPAVARPLTATAAAPIAATPIVAAPTAGLRPGAVNRTSVGLDATYAVNLAVRLGDGVIRMNAGITVTNTSGGPIDRLELNTVAARLGAMTLDRVTVNNRIVRATVSDQTIVVPLGGILDPAASVGIRVIFHATLRTTTAGSDWLFTRSGGIIDLYRVVPWVSRRHPFGRVNQGDPFVTANSRRVDLVLITDRPMVAAINAHRLSVSADGKTQTFTAANVRDIPMTLSPDYRVSRSMLGAIEVLVYTRPGGRPESLMAQARRSLQREAALLGPYPWPRFIVAATPGGYPMEAPGAIWIPPGVASTNLPYIVAHETAHQWTPGLVGSDQWADPFADEAVADMVARYTLGIQRASRCAIQRLDLPITSYSAACYYEVIYIQGGNWLNDLRRQMGDARYWTALRSYIAAHRWGIAGTRLLLDALDAATPIDVAALARPRFPGLF